MIGTTVNGPNGQVYPTSSNDLVKITNSGNFEPDPFKSTSKRSNRHKNKNKSKQKEGKEEATVGGVIKAAPIHPAEEEPDPTEHIPDSNNVESSKDGSDESSQEENSSNNDDDIDTDMERVFVMINSGFNEEANMFDPKAQRKSTMPTATLPLLTMKLLVV